VIPLRIYPGKSRKCLERKPGKDLLAVQDNDEPKNINIPAKRVPKFKTRRNLKETVR
jgi:hypothetical protein